VARLVRIARIIRVLRGARAAKNIFAVILIHRARNTFAAVVFGSFLLLLFSALAIVTVEPSMAPRDTFWWCLFTLITGEYGDFLPASTEGRIITVLLMTAGVALFGTFTASEASFFLEEDQEDDERRDVEILHEIGRLAEEVAELRKLMMGDTTRG
ncbi:MAG: two pore domain potassium channel family protein, partial [Planctomycetes bacterium]|nr:two pore domain potassium channel family protein [Planctomycetota bacterium]